MANFTDYLRNTFVNWFLPDEIRGPMLQLLNKYSEYRAYAAGQHKRQLLVKPNQADDNLVINHISLVIERSISMLFGKEIKFDLPGEDDAPEAEYLNGIWKANKKGILLHKLGQFGGTYGTCFVKIIPDGLNLDGAPVHRLIALHPGWVEVVTDGEDVEKVEKYVIRYNTCDADGNERARKEVIERIYANEIMADGRIYQTTQTSQWQITNYIADSSTNGKWQQMGEVVTWDYDFPPVHHWQNLPNAEGCYGKSDIEGILEPQDRYNFIQSNNSKIIRYHAHPKTWGRGLASTSKASWGPDEMILANSETAVIQNLEMVSDLASSRALALDIRQCIYDLSRTVDMTSLADKVGALTNFGLRVLFMDALNKNDTKRLLYGDGLSEINRRLLLLNNMKADVGEIKWPDPLPVNEVEQSQGVTADLTNKIVSRQTASTKRGYDWTEEEARMAADQTANGDIGAQILKAFGQGGGQGQ